MVKKNMAHSFRIIIHEDEKAVFLPLDKLKASQNPLNDSTVAALQSIAGLEGISGS